MSDVYRDEEPPESSESPEEAERRRRAVGETQHEHTTVDDPESGHRGSDEGHEEPDTDR